MSTQQTTGNPAVDAVMAAEAELMRAATEFAYQWGRDQTTNTKMSWLEMHLARWHQLTVAAVKYAEAIE